MGYKARILDIKGNKAVVFTSQAEFKQMPLKQQNVKIGDEIKMSTAFFKGPLSITKMGLAAAAMVAVFLITMVAVHNAARAQIARYYTVDINPSIELATDANDTVISAEGQNEDGTKLLEGLNLKGMSAEDAITSIAQKAAEQGFILPEQENDIVVTVTDVTDNSNTTPASEGDTAANTDNGDSSTTNGSSSNGEKNLPDENALTNKINQALASARLSVKVSILATKEEIRQLAKEQGISVGKYAILAEAQSQGLNITIDDIKYQSIKKAIEAAGGDFKAIVLAVKRDSNLGQAMKAFNQQRKTEQKGSNEQLEEEQSEETNASQEQTQIQENTQTREQKANSGEETMIQEQNQTQVKEDTQSQQKNGSDKKQELDQQKDNTEQESGKQQKDNAEQESAEQQKDDAQQESAEQQKDDAQQESAEQQKDDAEQESGEQQKDDAQQKSSEQQGTQAQQLKKQRYESQTSGEENKTQPGAPGQQKGPFQTR